MLPMLAIIIIDPSIPYLTYHKTPNGLLGTQAIARCELWAYFDRVLVTVATTAGELEYLLR